MQGIYWSLITTWKITSMMNKGMRDIKENTGESIGGNKNFLFLKIYAQLLFINVLMYSLIKRININANQEKSLCQRGRINIYANRNKVPMKMDRVGSQMPSLENSWKLGPFYQ